MKRFESTAKIDRPVNEVYDFLADLNNHQQLMPENIEDWQSTYDEASFGIKNMAKLSVKVANRIGNREVKIIPASKPPFDVELKWSLVPDGDHTVTTFTIAADLNMMMKMVASGPLQKLVDQEMQRLKTLLS